MSKGWKIAIVVLLAAAVVGSVALKAQKSKGAASVAERGAATTADVAPAPDGSSLEPGKAPPDEPKADSATSAKPPARQTNQLKPTVAPQPPKPKALPKLVDLGATKCIPCKMMAPILEELKAEYAARLRVDFVDVWENPGAGNEYSIQVIPTQIFYDASGKELFRHEGFMSKQDILDKCKELGIDFGSRMDVEPLLPE